MMKYELQRPVSCLFICVGILLGVQSVQAQESSVFYGVSLEQMEMRFGDEGERNFNWDGDAFIGTDEWKLRWYGKGEIDTDSGEREEFENRLMVSRPISDFFDIKAGIRYDTPTGPDRAYAVLGLTGLAPQWIEVDADFFVSEKGKTSARIDAEYELLLTNYLILQPSLEMDFAFSEDHEIGVGSGLNSIEAGLRLSYDVLDRAISPYIGISWEEKFGQTADFSEDHGEDTSNFSFVLGTRFVF